MYAEKLKQFENVENLGGKAWEHAVMIDCAEKTSIKDCSMHCFHFQQMFELLFKHLLETRSEYGAFPRTDKLDSLLELIIKDTNFRTDIERFSPPLVTVTVCAEAYRYAMFDFLGQNQVIKMQNRMSQNPIEKRS